MLIFYELVFAVHAEEAENGTALPHLQPESESFSCRDTLGTPADEDLGTHQACGRTVKNMQDYYDPNPLIFLEQHIVIAGYLGDETRRIGYHLAALTGLGVNDLDRKIEHHAGKSVWELIWNQGEPQYRQLERQYLVRLLTEKPNGIITLGDGALIDEGNRRRVLAESQLVVLDLDLPNIYWRIKSTSLGQKSFWHPLHAGPVERYEQIRPFYERREPGFAQAHDRIEMRGKGRKEAVEELLEIIGSPQ